MCVCVVGLVGAWFVWLAQRVGGGGEGDNDAQLFVCVKLVHTISEGSFSSHLYGALGVRECVCAGECERVFDKSDHVRQTFLNIDTPPRPRSLPENLHEF